MKKKKYKKNKLFRKIDVNGRIENNIENINFSDIISEVKGLRNKFIIKNKLNILCLNDDIFIKQIFSWCLSTLNENKENNKVLDKLYKLAIRYDIIPFNNDGLGLKIISFHDYKNKLKNTKLKIFDEDIIYIKKYIEFIFISYHLAYYRTEIISKDIEKELEIITNTILY